MAMNIANKLEELRIRARDNRTYAITVANAARDAIIVGMKDDKGETTTEWKTLMGYVTTTPKELNRLNGKDDTFMASDWGKFCLVYIAGDITCTAETPGTTGPKRTMTLPELAHRDLLGVLDREAGDEALGEAPGEESIMRQAGGSEETDGK